MCKSKQQKYIRKFVGHMRTCVWTQNICNQTGLQTPRQLEEANLFQLENGDERSQWKRYIPGKSEPEITRVEEVGECTLNLPNLEKNFESTTIFTTGPLGAPLWSALKKDKPLIDITNEWVSSLPWPKEVVDLWFKRVALANDQVKSHENGKRKNVNFKPWDPLSICRELNIEPPKLSNWHYLVKSILYFHIAIEDEILEHDMDKNAVGWDTFSIEDDADFSNSDFPSHAEIMESEFDEPWINYPPITDKELAKAKILHYLNILKNELNQYGLLPQDFTYILESHYLNFYLEIAFHKRKSVARWENGSIKGEKE